MKTGTEWFRHATAPGSQLPMHYHHFLGSNQEAQSRFNVNSRRCSLPSNNHRHIKAKILRSYIQTMMLVNVYVAKILILLPYRYKPKIPVKYPFQNKTTHRR